MPRVARWHAVLGVISVLLIIGQHQTGGHSHDTVPASAHNNTGILVDARHVHRTGYQSIIPVNIRLEPAHYLHGKNYIQTGLNFTATAEILDDKFKNVTIEYQWSVRNKTIKTQPNASEIIYKFNQADTDNFLEVLVFHHPNDTGVSNKSFVIRDPISVKGPDKSYLEHGELLNVTLKFEGTGAFSYCHSFCFENHDGIHEKSCKECSPDITTDGHEVRIIQYLHSIGNWTLFFVVDNIASRVAKNYSIVITGIVRPKSVPFVPIVSSILAALILLSGLVLHLKFKRTIATETADFDFIRHDYNDQDESFWEEEQSFAQRVRYLLFRVNQLDHDSSMTGSNISGVY